MPSGPQVSRYRVRSERAPLAGVASRLASTRCDTRLGGSYRARRPTDPIYQHDLAPRRVACAKARSIAARLNFLSLADEIASHQLFETQS
jgi:hypothetical protein